MKKNYIHIALMALVFSLFACSSNTEKEKHQSLTSDALPYSEIIECIDDLHLLKKLNKKEYQSASKNYIAITHEFDFLNTNENIMDSDSKNYLRYKLNMKMSSLCNKIKYLSFTEIKRQSKLINI